MDIQNMLMCGGSALVGAGILKGPVETLNEFWYIHFGKNIHQEAEILKAKAEKNKQLFGENIITEVKNIPEENLKEPKTNIIGPAMEASKYYVEEPELRSMFAKLIASSMDKTKDAIIHSSYVEIIKQMSPLYANNLICIYNSHRNQAPICKYNLMFTNHTNLNLYTNIFLSNPSCSDQNSLSPSLSNLERLGLIKMDYSQWISNEEYYKDFYNTKEYFESERTLEDYKKTNLPNDLVADKIDTQKGIADLTPFGKNFVRTCM
ncbi:DUF4393 domain-containing protein [Peptostreptococcus equinus]|uniref:DUF4393 domain-containing protein n=1 Tax=Peptostreptococcus equinus TaxID=3003601 RepID=A0ABY7JTZ5_9FIRM|nr:DUF4393 domain-containing protein [Peptostreptococcus sp. CBA3647]WAW15435.1 DUF4393 domain-containing protein [Peptostreptococcus sp. CBA3647]